VRTRNPRWIKQRVDDTYVQAKIDELLNGVPLNEYRRWIYFPWSGEMIHLLSREEFRELFALPYPSYICCWRVRQTGVGNVI